MCGGVNRKTVLFPFLLIKRPRLLLYQAKVAVPEGLSWGRFSEGSQQIFMSHFMPQLSKTSSHEMHVSMNCECLQEVDEGKARCGCHLSIAWVRKMGFFWWWHTSLCTIWLGCLSNGLADETSSFVDKFHDCDFISQNYRHSALSSGCSFYDPTACLCVHKHTFILFSLGLSRFPWFCLLISL